MSRFRNILRAIKQKWAPSRTKQAIWDSEYQSGTWKHCEVTPGAFVYAFVEKYCQKGSILDLGCGAGNTGNEIDADSYATYTGVDVSVSALDKARRRSAEAGRSDRNLYVQGHIESYRFDRPHSVILFRESIYYIPRVRIKSTIKRYRKYLVPDSGVIIVNVSESASKHCLGILSLLERHFAVVDKAHRVNSDEYVLVFR